MPQIEAALEAKIDFLAATNPWGGGKDGDNGAGGRSAARRRKRGGEGPKSIAAGVMERFAAWS